MPPATCQECSPERRLREDLTGSVTTVQTMADDEPTGPTDAPDRERERRNREGGLSLSLPPLRLPPLFPERFRVLWPAPGEAPRRPVSARTVVAALLLFDVVDAVLALTTDSAAVAAVRVVGGALVAATAFGSLGAVYVWEAAAAVTGLGGLTVVPTLTVLVVIRSLREVL